MTELDKLVSAAKSLDEDAPDEAGERMWAKIAGRVAVAGAATAVAVKGTSAASAATGTAATGTTAATTASAGLSLAKVGLGLAFVGSVGIGVGVVALQTDAEPAAVEVATESRAVPTAPPVAPAPREVVRPEPEPEPEPDIEIIDDPPPVRTPSRSRGARTPKPDAKITPATALAEESNLLRLARVASSKGRHGEALGHLRSHATRFPKGELLEVRRALQVRVLCDLGRTEKATAAAKRFLAAHGGSALAGQVRASCAFRSVNDDRGQ